LAFDVRLPAKARSTYMGVAASPFAGAESTMLVTEYVCKVTYIVRAMKK